MIPYSNKFHKPGIIKKIQKKIICPTCDGSGVEPEAVGNVCSECGGTGEIDTQ